MVSNAVILGFVASASAAAIMKTVPRGQPDTPYLNSACFNPISFPEMTSKFDCPRKIQQTDDHVCPFQTQHDCQAYCEIRLFWNWGKEVPFDNSDCGPGDACQLQNTQSAAVTNTYEINVSAGLSAGTEAIQSAFNFGASFSYSTQLTMATGITHTRPEESKDTCGYWAFIPYYVTSCGTLSTGTFISEAFGVGTTSGTGTCQDTKTVENYCVSSPWLGIDGKPQGRTVFVAKDCESGKKAGFCVQDPVYLKPGVASDDSVYNDFVEVHKNRDINYKDEDYPDGILATMKAVCLKDPMTFSPYI